MTQKKPGMIEREFGLPDGFDKAPSRFPRDGLTAIPMLYILETRRRG